MQERPKRRLRGFDGLGADMAPVEIVNDAVGARRGAGRLTDRRRRDQQGTLQHRAPQERRLVGLPGREAGGDIIDLGAAPLEVLKPLELRAVEIHPEPPERPAERGDRLGGVGAVESLQLVAELELKQQDGAWLGERHVEAQAVLVHQVGQERHGMLAKLGQMPSRLLGDSVAIGELGETLAQADHGNLVSDRLPLGRPGPDAQWGDGPPVGVTGSAGQRPRSALRRVS